mgnify:CR=1 FL=1
MQKMFIFINWFMKINEINIKFCKSNQKFDEKISADEQEIMKFEESCDFWFYLAYNTRVLYLDITPPVYYLSTTPGCCKRGKTVAAKEWKKARNFQ